MCVLVTMITTYVYQFIITQGFSLLVMKLQYPQKDFPQKYFDNLGNNSIEETTNVTVIFSV